MSLNRLLAVGRSFVGIRGEKSPFEMKKDCLLPIFQASPRFAGSAANPNPLPSERQREKALSSRTALREPPRDEPFPAVPAPAEGVSAPAQTDWLEKKAVGANPFEARLTAPAPVPAPALPAPPKRSLLSVLTFGLFGRKRAPSLVQGELSLENVQVLRNDLADADLELVLKKRRPQARKASAAARSWTTVDEQQPWTKLAARLFETEQR